MALEFHVLKGSGNSHKDYSEDMASFEEDQYDLVMKLAKEANLPIIASMSNYYGQYKVGVKDLDSFSNEIKSLLPRSTNDLQPKLNKLIDIINQAKTSGLQVATFPD